MTSGGDLARAGRTRRLEAIVRWAREVPGPLRTIHQGHGACAHLRPTSNGLTLLGLTEGRPQRGKSRIKDLNRLVADFESVFLDHCVPDKHGRKTPEKELQSALIRDAYLHGRNMNLLAAACAGTDDEVTPVFVTDEIALPTAAGRIVCDLFALRPVTDHCFRPILIELKYKRQMKRLIEQVESYAALVEEQLVGFQSLASALLERQLTLVGPCERWIVWPALAHHDVDPREAELARRGIRVVTYRQQDNEFVLRAGAGPAATIGLRGCS